MDIGTAYVEGATIQAMVGIFAVMIIAVVLVVLFSNRKSYNYRKHISDMYVASKIRFFAEEDKLDLVAEEKAFKSWVKKQPSDIKDVDKSVELELIERIEDSNDKTKKK